MTTDRSAAEMRGLLRFAQGLGLNEETVLEIYEAVGQEAAAAGVGDDDRMARCGSGCSRRSDSAHEKSPEVEAPGRYVDGCE